MKDDTGRRKQLLSTTALSKLLFDWQTGGVGVAAPVPLAVCQRLAQVPGLRAPLEHIVLHTATGEKARDMRRNLRLFDPSASTNEDKSRISLQRLEARQAELAHLIGETKKAVERASAEVHQARLTADQAAVERDVQQQRVSALRCQALSCQALAAYATSHTSRMQGVAQSFEQMQPTPSHPEAPSAVSEVLMQLRQHMGEGDTRTPARVPPLGACLTSPGIGRIVRRLQGVSCAEGQSVLSLLHSTANSACHELRTMSAREAPPRQGLPRMRELLGAGHAEHMRMFVEEEELKEEIAGVRQQASHVCAQILGRVDHQSTLARQLTEAQARERGVAVHLRCLEEQVASVAAKRRMRGAADHRGVLADLQRQREGKHAQRKELMELLLQDAAATPAEAQPGNRSITELAVGVRAALQEASEAQHRQGLAALCEALPGTGNRLLDGVSGISTAPDTEEDNPVHSLEHSALELGRLVAERAYQKCAGLALARDAGSRACNREAVSKDIEAAMDTWQHCVAGFSHVVHRIKDAKDLLQGLDTEYAALSRATADLRDQPASLLLHDIQRLG